MRQEITKLDGVRQQLLTAVRLYFTTDDWPSIHTLSAAALEVVLDLSEKQGCSDTFRDWVRVLVMPEHQKLFMRKFRAAANFLKHADRDSESAHDFNSEATENVLFLAIYHYRQLATESIAQFELYLRWWRICHPEVFDLTPDWHGLANDPCISDRKRFWNAMWPLLHRREDDPNSA